MIKHDCTVTTHEITESGDRCSCGYFDRNLKTCVSCDSVRMVHVRLDTDWGDGGDVYLINSEIHYNKPQDTSGDRPDIDVDICLACGMNQ